MVAINVINLKTELTISAREVSANVKTQAEDNLYRWRCYLLRATTCISYLLDQI